jgi:hypothetical protein
MAGSQLATGTRTFNQIIASSEHRDWVNLLWDKAGRVIILSDYGNWSFFWGCRGEGVSTEKFLAELDMHYMGKKMLGDKFWDFDLDSTVDAINACIKEYLKNGYLSEGDSFTEYAQVKTLSEGGISFEMWCQDAYLDDAYELAVNVPSNDWQQLWDRLWVPFVQPELKRISNASL